MLRSAMSNAYNTILALKETCNHLFRKNSMLDILLLVVKGDGSSRPLARIVGLRCRFVPVVNALLIAYQPNTKDMVCDTYRGHCDLSFLATHRCGYMLPMHPSEGNLNVCKT